MSFSDVVCLLLFSYEFHRQLDLMEKSHQVSVMYVITNFFFILSILWGFERIIPIEYAIITKLP
jgi:hypothetical protein